MGSWNGDQYTNWMTQNGINLFGTKIDSPTAHAIGGSLSALFSAASKDYEGIGQGLGQMFGAMQEQYRASMIPNSIGGQVNSGDVLYAYNKMSPTYYKMTIRSEYAAKIANNKEMLNQMIKTLQYDREALANTNDTHIGMLQNERKWKMNALKDDIKDKLRNDPELNELTKEYNKLRFMIKTDNRFNTTGINDKPYSAEESIQERNQLVEQHVQQLNDEGEQD